jgi:hypothetical protein
MLNARQKILEKLAAADRERQKETGAVFLLDSLKYPALLVLVLFAVDAAFHVGPAVRLALDLLLVASVLGFFVGAWHIAWRVRNRPEHVARFLEERDPGLGSRLINLIQLEAQTSDPSLSSATQSLARQAVEQYSLELADQPLENLARTGRIPGRAKAAGLVTLSFLAVLAVGFPVTVVELARFADPFGDHPAYSFTRLEIVDPGPAGTNVLFGKGIVVRVRASGHQPSQVFLTSSPEGLPGKTATLPMFSQGGGLFNQVTEPVQTQTVAFAHLKNGETRSRQVRVGVVLTPQLDGAFVRIAAPPYTGIKAEEKPYAFKPAQALQGSQVHFRLVSNRPLKSGWIEFTGADQAPRRVPLSPIREHEVAGSFVAEDSGRLRFGLEDVNALPSQTNWEGSLTVTHDLPPEIRITEPEVDSLVAIDYRLEAHFEASDDYGLRLVRIQRGINGLFLPPVERPHDGIVHNSRETVRLDFSKLNVQPGDEVTLFGEAIDNAPEPHLARSQTVRLKVVSVEDYNNILRRQTDISELEEKYASLADDLRELIRNQKELGEAAEKLAAQATKASEKEREALMSELDSLLAKQNELNRKLDRHAERMETFVRDKPLYDIEMELQDLLRKEANQIRRSASTNDAETRQVAEASSPAAGNRKLSPNMLSDFKRASDAQRERLGDVDRKAQEQIAEALQDMGLMQELLKDFNLFESLYRVQEELASQAQAYNRAGELGREDQLALKELAGTEKQVGELLGELVDKLREHAKAAEKAFPKAAQSGMDLADKIGELRLGNLARQATGQMLAGNGERSFRLSDRLKTEMAKLFSDCQGGNCPSGDELDTYLKLTRSMRAGKSFSQMAQSRNFGSALGRSMAPGTGTGEGLTGASGYAMTDAPGRMVIGNERATNQGRTSSKTSRGGKGKGELAGRGGTSDAQSSDTLKDLKPINRQSGAVAAEVPIEEYNQIVDSYFKALTTRKAQ